MPNKDFWPNCARLDLTVSMQFEAGAQPISGAPGPVSQPIAPGYPDGEWWAIHCCQQVFRV